MADEPIDFQKAVRRQKANESNDAKTWTVEECLRYAIDEARDNKVGKVVIIMQEHSDDEDDRKRKITSMAAGVTTIELNGMIAIAQHDRINHRSED